MNTVETAKTISRLAAPYFVSSVRPLALPDATGKIAASISRLRAGQNQQSAAPHQTQTTREIKQPVPVKIRKHHALN